ncbi:SDR family NAD(P)-dependent oxidoreductase [Demequina sp. NBRC 110057]|uniref:SDR family NAD(P)-dependent oxidoreductase n=1 Tax=Demequina sp. NBRC 110057 TaxID=1570346 RepID=UPI0009FCAA39|nr:SDR family oxidoreductase [Demequina sp. NBRC 110057]
MTTPRKVLAVTGASRGIGRAIALRAAAEGWSVVVGYRRDEEAADAVAAEIRSRGGEAWPVTVDITEASSLARFFAEASRRGQLGGVVANAGAATAVGGLSDQDPGALARDIEVTLTGPILTCRAALDHLGAGASIVLIGSAATQQGSPGTYVHYAAAKAGVAMFAQGLARELGPAGIRVSCVEPGTVRTDFHADPERPDKVAAAIPWGRPGEPGEIAGAVAWLLSEDAAYASGAVLRVGGGL